MKKKTEFIAQNEKTLENGTQTKKKHIRHFTPGSVESNVQMLLHKAMKPLKVRLPEASD